MSNERDGAVEAAVERLRDWLEGRELGGNIQTERDILTVLDELERRGKDIDTLHDSLNAAENAS